MVRIEFETDTDAFREHHAGADAAFYAETARILLELVTRIDSGIVSGLIQDLNGNTIGWFDLDA